VNRRRLLILGWVIVLGLSATLPLSALFHGIIHVGPSSFVARGALRQPVIAVASDVYLPKGNDQVVVTVLGNVHVQGVARDDIVTLGGRVYLGRGTHVLGDVLAVFSGIYRAPGVHVDGRLGGAVQTWDGRARDSHVNITGALLTSIRLGLAAGLALLLIGTCITVVFPWQVVLISSTLREAPVKSVGAGILCMLTFVFLVVPLGLSLAGLPFAVLLSAAATLGWLFGMTAAAIVVGRTVARGQVSLLWATAAGLLLLALSMAIPVVGPLLVSFTGIVGAGALAVALVSRSRPAPAIH
jgi:hypothetical protein